MMKIFKQIIVIVVVVFALFNLKDNFASYSANASVDFNCYCLNGSLIPFNYPNVKKLNTADFDSCNQECANVSAKYFSFSTVAHIGTTLVSKTPASAKQNEPVVTATGSPSQSQGIVPGISKDPNSGIIKCGRPGQNMCTLCDIIKGFNDIIQYLMKIAIGVALLAMAIGGIMYIVSAGDTGMIDMGKKAITNAAIGFVVIFAGYLIVNTTINYLGTVKNSQTGEATFGFNITSWGKFDCTANPNR